MKALLKVLIIGIAGFLLVGCEEDDNVVFVNTVPAAPQGVFTVTGNNSVYIYWNGPYEKDIDEYWVYRSLSATTGYTFLGARDAVNNSNLDLITYEYIDNTAINGNTYYYAIASVDNSGQVSELSAETIFDTPRDEGTAVLVDVAVDSTVAGYDLSGRTNVQYNNINADIFVDRVGGVFYINAADAFTDLQDVGYSASFDGVGYAPTEGWSENGWSEIILNHTYIVWTRDLNYAKMWVEAISANSVFFRWAYQTDPDNPELIVVGNSNEKPNHGQEYLLKPKGNDVPVKEAR